PANDTHSIHTTVSRDVLVFVTGTEADIRGERAVAGKAGKETIVVPCTECEATVAGIVQGSYVVYAEEPGFYVRWSLLSCPSCESAVLVVQDDEDASYGGGSGERWGKPTRLYPDMDDRQLGPAVPTPIRAAFSEARACYKEAKAYTACAIMCRKVLEGV